MAAPSEDQAKIAERKARFGQDVPRAPGSLNFSLADYSTKTPKVVGKHLKRNGFKVKKLVNKGGKTFRASGFKKAMPNKPKRTIGSKKFTNRK